MPGFQPKTDGPIVGQLESSAEPTEHGPVPHAVARLRSTRLARSAKPFLARGGIKGPRCPGCRLVPSHCLCDLQPQRPTKAGVCLLMSDIEPLKPSNTGWLIADVVLDTTAFGWARTEVAPGCWRCWPTPNGSLWWFFRESLWPPSGWCAQCRLWLLVKGLCSF